MIEFMTLDWKMGSLLEHLMSNEGAFIFCNCLKVKILHGKMDFGVC